MNCRATNNRRRIRTCFLLSAVVLSFGYSLLVVGVSVSISFKRETALIAPHFVWYHDILCFCFSFQSSHHPSIAACTLYAREPRGSSASSNHTAASHHPSRESKRRFPSLPGIAIQREEGGNCSPRATIFEGRCAVCASFENLSGHGRHTLLYTYYIEEQNYQSVQGV